MSRVAGQVTAIQTGLLDGLLEPYTAGQKLQTYVFENLSEKEYYGVGKGEDLPGLVASVPTYFQGVAGLNPVAGLTLLIIGGLFSFLKITKTPLQPSGTM